MTIGEAVSIVVTVLLFMAGVWAMNRPDLPRIVRTKRKEKV
jgi:hypothetical protein